MDSNLDFALMSANIYQQSRNRENIPPSPPGWTRIRYDPDESSRGFSAGVFKRGNEVVVTYPGTNEGIDWLANLALGFAAPSSQLVSAARIYLE